MTTMGGLKTREPGKCFFIFKKLHYLLLLLTIIYLYSQHTTILTLKEDYSKARVPGNVGFLFLFLFCITNEFSTLRMLPPPSQPTTIPSRVGDKHERRGRGRVTMKLETGTSKETRTIQG